MSTLFQLLFSGLALGAAYALTALGFVAIYRSSQVFNFAHGELLAFGAFAMTTFCNLGLPWPLALVVTMVVTGLVAAAIERLVLRRMVGRPVFVTIILTIFIGFLLREIIHLIWGNDLRGMPTPWPPTAVVHLGGAAILVNSLVTAAFAVVILLGFFLFMKRSRLGVAMRAAAVDQEAALAMGIDVGRVFSVTWFIAGMLAALAGVCLCLFPGQVSDNVATIAYRAFPAVIVGGLESPLGTVIAALLLGLCEMLCQGYVNPRLGSFGQSFHEILPYGLMILFLVVKPYGLFGVKRVERV